MARTVHCIKLGKEAEGLDFPPYPGELGKRIYQNVSKQAWADWLKHQTMLVNENRLNLADQRPLEDGNFHYNLGLAFLDVGDTELALKHAKRAYALGYRLPGLKSRLEKLGKWRDD